MSPEAVVPNPWMITPFAALLVTMAVAPLLAGKWWERHHPKVAFGLGAITLGYYLFILRDVPRVAETAHDYFSFIVLVGSLFVVSGGIHLGIKGEATPLANTFFLFVGALTANILGTTGAAMLLIRPWIRLNQYRIKAHHVIFFIFIVANTGGCLTPIGDPPLFLGYLEGVPFWWPAQHCWPMWATCVGVLLMMFYVADKINFARALREVRPPETTNDAWKFAGSRNLFFLAVILGAVFVNRPIFLREALMLAAAAASYFTTPGPVHASNNFNFHPVREVVILFAGIFATMMPALDWLNQNAHALLGHEAGPGIFFWGTGTLSAVLDNAPTYLGFLNVLSGLSDARDIGDVLSGSSLMLTAISVGAVFFGAATYIGNVPNFMVKAIAEREGIHMPTFMGYIFKFTLPFLLPTLILIWMIFFRG
jgi:Na+/H+ antiporter NhaD/arsenite permease-like protein